MEDEVAEPGELSVHRDVREVQRPRSTEYSFSGTAMRAARRFWKLKSESPLRPS